MGSAPGLAGHGWFLAAVAAAAVGDEDGHGTCELPGACSTQRYHWPRARGHEEHYGASPHLGPSNLTVVAPAWTWHHPRGRYHTIVVGGPLIDGDSNIYLAAAEGIRKFSPEGQSLWTHSVAWSTGLMAAAPSLMGGALFANTRNGHFFAVSMRSGELLWSIRAANATNLDSAAVEAHEGVVIAAAEPALQGGNQRVLALLAGDGSFVWDFWPDAALQNFVPCFEEGGSLIFQDQEATVYRLGLHNGTLLWKSSAATAAHSTSVPAPEPPRQPPEPEMPARRASACPKFPLAEGARLTLQLDKARTLWLWRRQAAPGGMVALWFHRSAFTLWPWARIQLRQPLAALTSRVPAAMALILLVYGCPLAWAFQLGLWRKRGGSGRPPLLVPMLLVGTMAPFAALTLTPWGFANGANALAAYGKSADAILDEGGIIVGLDGDFDRVPFYGWQSVSEEQWGENDDWRFVDEVVACAFEQVPGLDRRRVHAAGFSAGAVVAAKVGFMRPGYIASVAPISGALVPLLREQWATPGTEGHHFAAMLTLGGENDVVMDDIFRLFERNTMRYSWRVASQFTRDTLLSRGQLAFICEHSRGHDDARALSHHLYRFFKDHPYGGASKYATEGLPPEFDHAACEDTRGLGISGGWRYACCSHSLADTDDRTHWLSMAHLQTLKRREGIPDGVVPYVAPSVNSHFVEKLHRIYGRTHAAQEPTTAPPRILGVYGCGPSRGGRNFTVGGATLASGGFIFAISGRQSSLMLELPGCLHAYRNGQLIWQRGLPHPGYRAAAGRLRGGFAVVVPTGKSPSFPGQLSFAVHTVCGVVVGLLLWPLLGRRACLVGTLLGSALGAWRLQLSGTRPAELWAFEAESGRLLWRFEPPTWSRMAAAGDAEGLLTRMRLGWFRTVCLPSAWSSPTIDGNGTVFIGHMSGAFYAVVGDLDGDGVISGDGEVSSFDASSGFPPPGPSLAPGLLAAASCDSLFVFRNG